MKQFNRTLSGKVLFFLISSLTLFALVLSVFGAILFFECGLYGKTEVELRHDTAEDEKYALIYNVIDYFIAVRPVSAGFFDPGPDAFCYTVTDSENTVLLSSTRAPEPGREAEVQYLYLLRNDGGYYLAEEQDAVPPSMEDDIAEVYQINLFLSEDFYTRSLTEAQSQIIRIFYTLRYWVYVIITGSLLLFILSYVALLSGVGRHPGDDLLYPGPLSRFPYDILVLIFLFSIGCMISWVGSRGDDMMMLPAMALTAFLASPLFIGLSVSAAGRIKEKRFFKSTLLYLLLFFCKQIVLWIFSALAVFFSRLSVLWKGILILSGLSLLELIVITGNYAETDNILLFWFLEKIVILPLIFWGILMLRRLEKGGKALSEGDLSYHTDIKRLLGSFKKHAENLNQIGQGMSRAVEERLKSERMKTQLITNVSHDLKTPLTSVINYADLIGKENCDNPKITEYAEVLLRQSVRLKRLVDDLVELSKASTGNLEVNPASCDASVFLSQAGGEYEDRLEKAGLTLITSLPETPLTIMADGRRMWRIFDNLMNNILKYALPGTRVYLSLERIENRAVITFKNTSRDRLTLSPEELTERFVRGDSSRHTEGSGLGLSIARSLTELQGGTLSLTVDGDLFKAVLSFPAAE